MPRSTIVLWFSAHSFTYGSCWCCCMNSATAWQACTACCEVLKSFLARMYIFMVYSPRSLALLLGNLAGNVRAMGLFWLVFLLFDSVVDLFRIVR